MRENEKSKSVPSPKVVSDLDAVIKGREKSMAECAKRRDETQKRLDTFKVNHGWVTEFEALRLKNRLRLGRAELRGGEATDSASSTRLGGPKGPGPSAVC